jgi:hypothetical protein
MGLSIKDVTYFWPIIKPPPPRQNRHKKLEPSKKGRQKRLLPPLKKGVFALFEASR